MQLLSHLQWWSNWCTHLLHVLQCLEPSWTQHLQMWQKYSYWLSSNLCPFAFRAYCSITIGSSVSMLVATYPETMLPSKSKPSKTENVGKLSAIIFISFASTTIKVKMLPHSKMNTANWCKFGWLLNPFVLFGFSIILRSEPPSRSVIFQIIYMFKP